jgi:iron transport multicopper oxidase
VDGNGNEGNQVVGDGDGDMKEKFSAIPMRRDTILTHPNSHLIIRFRTTNPGVWLFHCHIEWHVASGLMATFIESPLEIQDQLAGKIPKGHFDVCREAGTPIVGNAAGNKDDLWDLSGERKAPGALPSGFTKRGVGALVGSCVAAFLGMGVIAWYGMVEMK